MRNVLKVLRILTGKQWNEHSAPLFKEMNILTLRDINTLQVACFLYKAVNNELPFSFKNYFILNKTTHDHFTRCCDNIHIVGCNSVITSFSIRVYGPKYGMIYRLTFVLHLVYIFLRKKLNYFCWISMFKCLKIQLV